MADVNIMEHIDETGAFTEGFADAAKSIAGEEHKDTKLFEKVSDVSTLIKVALDTKSAYGKKLEGVIQKPAEGATDQEKADYRSSLLKELGTPEKAEDYEFAKPESLPAGVAYNQELEDRFREVFLKRDVPADMAKGLVEDYNEIQLGAIQARLDEQQKAFEEDSKGLDKKWTGDAKIKNNRLAFKAIMRFGTEDLQTLLKDAKINEDVGNHQKWHDLGFSPSQREIWFNIGSATGTAEAITDEGTPAAREQTGVKKAVEKIYDHPTSVKARAGRR